MDNRKAVSLKTLFFYAVLLSALFYAPADMKTEASATDQKLKTFSLAPHSFANGNRSTALSNLLTKLFFQPKRGFPPPRISAFREKQIPVLELSNSCPHQCSICIYSAMMRDNDKHRMRFEEIRENIRQIKESGVKAVSLCFDFEIFYIPDLYKILREIHDNGLEVWIVTHVWDKNHSLAQRNAEEIAEKIDFPLHFNISLHAWHEEVLKTIYPSITKKEFFEALEEMEEIRQTGQFYNLSPEGIWKHFLESGYLSVSDDKETAVITDQFNLCAEQNKRKEWTDSEEGLLGSILEDLQRSKILEFKEKHRRPINFDSPFITSEIQAATVQVPDELPVNYQEFLSAVSRSGHSIPETNIRAFWDKLVSSLIITNSETTLSNLEFDRMKEEVKTVQWNTKSSNVYLPLYIQIDKLNQQKRMALEPGRKKQLDELSRKFIDDIAVLQRNKNFTFSLIPIGTSESFFPSVGQFHKEMIEKIRSSLSLPSDAFGSAWPVEWSLGGAAQTLAKYGYHASYQYDSGMISSFLRNLNFVCGADGEYYIIAEAKHLEESDCRDLLGPELIREGYAIDPQARQFGNIFWHKIIFPGSALHQIQIPRRSSVFCGISS